MINAFIAISNTVKAVAEAALLDDSHALHDSAKALFSHPDCSHFASECRERDLSAGKFNLYSVYLTGDQWAALPDVAAQFGTGVDIKGAWSFSTGTPIVSTEASLIYYFADRFDSEGLLIERTLENYLPLMNLRPSQVTRKVT